MLKAHYSTKSAKPFKSQTITAYNQSNQIHDEICERKVSCYMEIITVFT